jgi:hypothetical protein
MGRLVLYLFLLFLFLTVLRGLRIFLAAVFRSQGPRAARPGGTREAEMVRDPVCGTWIDRGLAVLVRRGAETVPVCSDECRRRLEVGP